MADFLGTMSDGEMDNFSEQFWTKVDSAPADFNATADQADDLKLKKDGFKSNLTVHIAAQADAKAKTQAKDTSRDALEAAIRFIIQQAKLNGVSDEKISELGVPTASNLGEAPEATRPVVISIDTGARFTHTVRFADEAAPNSKRLPNKTFGCEVYQKIGGEPPTNFKECLFRGLDSKTPYTWEFEPEDVGKMVYYMLRWRFKDESTSDWSITSSATVTG